MLAMLKAKTVEIAKIAKKIGKDDPRKIVYSMKVGLALTLVSLCYYYRPLYDGFGEAGMWVVMTVVVISEYTVGGTLSRSLNRGFATLLAGALGVGAEYLANLCGEKGEPVVLGLMVFILAALSTFIRFLPNVKKYDYGVMTFILTFSMVAVSGFRVSDILKLAHQRLAAVLVGVATCMIISIFIYPVWAGQDLHNQVYANIEKIAAFLCGFGDECLGFDGCEGCRVSDKDDNDGGRCLQLQGYKSVLNSKANEEALASYALWEPGHGGFKFGHPWEQYLRIGVGVRDCASLVEALHGFVNANRPKVETDVYRGIQDPSTRMSQECGKWLSELASAMKTMRFPRLAVIETHAQNARATSEELKLTMENYVRSNFQESMHFLSLVSVLTDILKCVEEISASVLKLSKKANFQCSKPLTPVEGRKLLRQGIVIPINDKISNEYGVADVVVRIDTPRNSVEGKNQQMG